MKQVVVIHGGTSFSSYNEYWKELKKIKLRDPRRNTTGWKVLLAKRLGTKYEVIAPRMPNAMNAQYKEWKLWFEKHIPFIKPGVVLVGHSLGGVFLAKYLSENRFPKKIRATLLVAAPHSIGRRVLTQFRLPRSLSKLEKQGGKIVLYHSADDKIVPFSELHKYQHALPGATVRALMGYNHFEGDRFPQILKDIRSL